MTAINQKSSLWGFVYENVTKSIFTGFIFSYLLVLYLDPEGMKFIFSQLSGTEKNTIVEILINFFSYLSVSLYIDIYCTS